MDCFAEQAWLFVDQQDFRNQQKNFSVRYVKNLKQTMISTTEVEIKSSKSSVTWLLGQYTVDKMEFNHKS